MYGCGAQANCWGLLGRDPRRDVHGAGGSPRLRNGRAIVLRRALDPRGTFDRDTAMNGTNPLPTGGEEETGSIGDRSACRDQGVFGNRKNLDRGRERRKRLPATVAPWTVARSVDWRQRPFVGLFGLLVAPWSVVENVVTTGSADGGRGEPHAGGQDQADPDTPGCQQGQSFGVPAHACPTAATDEVQDMFYPGRRRIASS